MRVVLLGVALLLSVHVAPASAQDPPLAWDDPQPIDRGHGLLAVDCPTEVLCVALDDGGNVVTRGGIVPIGQHLTELSCASTALCVAVDRHGNAISTTNPTGGADAWKTVRIAPEPCRAPEQHACDIRARRTFATGIDCPTPTLCVAVTAGGDIITTGNPTGDASAWDTAAVNRESCPDGVAACRPNIEAGFTAVSCSSASFCVAVDDQANVFTSTNPRGGVGAWKLSRNVEISGCRFGQCAARFFDVACPSQSLCVAGDDYANAVTSINPSADSPAWTPRRIASTPDVISVSCPSQRFCAALTEGAAYLSSAPATGPWIPSYPDSAGDEFPFFADIDCPSETRCVVVDSGGNVIVAGPALTPMQIAARVRSALSPGGAAPRIRTLLRRKRQALAFEVPLGGVLSIRWRARTPRGKLLTIASGKQQFATRGPGTVTLRFTRRGLKLLRGLRRVRVSAVGAYTTFGGQRVSAGRAFILRR